MACLELIVCHDCLGKKNFQNWCDGLGFQPPP
jgi:hypothetical protein